MLYKTVNYGGCLQAYALSEYLNSHGVNAEQILVDCTKGDGGSSNPAKVSLLYIKNILCKITEASKDFRIKKKLAQRRELFEEFISENIKTNKRVFSLRNIDDSADEYETFISGSDQVWHPSAVNRAYLLEFVPPTRSKISYAASIPVNSISKFYAQRLERSLSDFKAVSVREPNSVEIISRAAHRNDICCCVDPVFLLDRAKWSSIASQRIIKEKYLFCYFLGESIEQRILAKKHAQINGLIIVTFPNLSGHKRKCDDNFGDKRIYDASPTDFLSMINFAEYVMTDSFHATAFSCIFGKEFSVFGRDKYSAMGSRVYNLLGTCGCIDRFSDTPEKMTLEFIQSKKSNCEFSKMLEKRSESEKFLLSNLSHKYMTN